MKTQLNFPTSSPFFFSLLLLLHFPPSSSTSATTNRYAACSKTYNCGEITGIDYPFYGGDRPKECGHPNLNLNCNNDTSTTISILKVNYQILRIDQIKQILTIKRNDLSIGNICSDQFFGAAIDSSLFEYASNYINLTIQYGCPPLNFPVPQQFECTLNGIVYHNNYIVPGAQGAGACNASKVIQVHSSAFGGEGDLWDIGKLIEGGFDLRWKADSTECKECKNSGGSCGFDIKANRFDCVCPESDQPPQGSKSCGGSGGVNVFVDPEHGPQSHSLTTPPNSGGKKSSSTSINIILPIVGAVLAGVGIGWVIFYCRQRRKRLAVQSDHFSSTDKKELPTTPLANKDSLAPPSVAFTKSIPSYPSTKFDSRTETSYFGARIFTYTEIEEATEDFAEARELGDGGFGAVYYGVLSDGSVVAVKRLYENNYKRVEQFKNEVEILTRLRHPNLVMLYGCSSKRSKDLLLVYEYVPNGTVADHLHGNRASSGLLSWPVRLNIAVETAEALAYLHASDIIHRDVKTNNILLDNDFHVKVADFGLSRLFPVDATHVSTAPQGTPGYVDPEYYQMYQLTEKSDVYSFGVVLVELISSLPAVDTSRSRHDINLANMAINKIQNHAVHELVDQSLQFDSNSSVKRMVTSVAELAFQCLQQEKDMRPSMQGVLDTLRGIQSGGLNAQKVEVVDILADNGGSCKDATLPPSPGSVTDKSTGTSAKSSSE